MILVAPTAFKGTLGAAEAAAACAAGVRRCQPSEEVVVRPVSDGGPGLLDALRAGLDPAVGLHEDRVGVTGPRGGAVEARILRGSNLAVAESADACGLALIPAAARDPLTTTSRGVGELLLAATRPPMGAPPTLIVMGLGGSGTVDGGAGAAQALGWKLLNMAGRPVPPGGAGLERLATIEPPPPNAPFGPYARGTGTSPALVALADVRNPLLGPQGAAAVFGPQKGASREGVLRLEAGLERLARVVRRDAGVDVRGLEGAGAAGGLGAGLVAFAGARLVRGSDWVIEALGMDALLTRATLLVTGEGAWDAQSGMGKVTGALVTRARERGVPVLLVCGAIQGTPPAGAVALDGAGRVLDADALETLVAEGCRWLTVHEH